jgi:hypothetical protein
MALVVQLARIISAANIRLNYWVATWRQWRLRIGSFIGASIVNQLWAALIICRNCRLTLLISRYIVEQTLSISSHLVEAKHIIVQALCHCYSLLIRTRTIVIISTR